MPQDRKARHRLPPAAAILLISLAALLPLIDVLPQNGDEAQYGWSAAYYWRRLRRLSFMATSGPDASLDPEWAPLTYWTVTQPMGARFLYGMAMSITGTSGPPRPYLYGRAEPQGADTYLSGDALRACRLTAVLCAALGLALFAARLGWPGAAAAVLFLLVPGMRPSLASAWAEGPLLLGFGLCAITYRTRWFPITAGITATFKLTALPLWALSWWHPIGHKYSRLMAIAVTVITWSLFTPQSWFGGGPFYLVPMLAHRIISYVEQTAKYPNEHGIFWPTRYTWPFVLGLCLLITAQAPRAWRRWHSRQVDT